MATEKSTVAFIADQLAPLNVRTRAMFGEYALYCDEKVVALICDDTLFVKQTSAGANRVGDLELGEPYPGAKSHYAIDGDGLERREWLQDLIQATADALPTPKPKQAKKPKKK